MAMLVGTLAAGCRPVLPPEPAGRDATDPRAALPRWSPPPDATRTSAFAGETIDESPHMHHHGAAKTETEPK